jgi:hypothetical protein
MRRRDRREESGVHFICAFGAYDLIVFDNTSNREAHTKDPKDLSVVCMESEESFFSIHGIDRFFRYARANAEERKRIASSEVVLHKDDEEWFDSDAVFSNIPTKRILTDIHDILPLAAHALKCFGGYVETLDDTE